MTWFNNEDSSHNVEDHPNPKQYREVKFLQGMEYNKFGMEKVILKIVITSVPMSSVKMRYNESIKWNKHEMIRMTIVTPNSLIKTNEIE